MISVDRVLSVLPMYVFWPLDALWSTIVAALIWIALGVFVVKIHRRSRQISDPDIASGTVPRSSKPRRRLRGVRRSKDHSSGRLEQQSESAGIDRGYASTVRRDGAGEPRPDRDPGSAALQRPPRRPAPQRRPVPNLQLVPSSGMPPILLSGEIITIGRHLSNTIVIASPKASRHHARLERHNELWYLIDEQHSSGTSVNNERIPKVSGETPRQIRPGDVIDIGDARYRVTIEGDEEDAPSAREPSTAPLAERRAPSATLPTFPGGRVPPEAWSLNFGDATTRGDRRTNNDVVVARGNRVALADIAGTDEASEITYNAVRSALTKDSVLAELSLLDIISDVHFKVLQASESHNRHPMRSTLDLLALDTRQNRVVVEGAHIGDGTVYYAPIGSDTIETLTHAHNPEPGSPVLLKSIGTQSQGPPRPDLWIVPAAPGDRYVMASDGLTTALGDRVLDVLREALADGPNGAPAPQAVAERLVRSARDTRRHTRRLAELDAPPEASSLDNITVVVAEVAVVADGAADGREPPRQPKGLTRQLDRPANRIPNEG